VAVDAERQRQAVTKPLRDRERGRRVVNVVAEQDELVASNPRERRRRLRDRVGEPLGNELQECVARGMAE
jgi:hypothetical protein